MLAKLAATAASLSALIALTVAGLRSVLACSDRSKSLSSSFTESGMNGSPYPSSLIFLPTSSSLSKTFKGAPLTAISCSAVRISSGALLNFLAIDITMPSISSDIALSIARSVVVPSGLDPESAPMADSKTPLIGRPMYFRKPSSKWSKVL